MSEADRNEHKERLLTGRVVSTAMEKTVAVRVERLVKHPVYGKYIRRSTKMLVHDESSECRMGDTVNITPCRPMSKRKSWRVSAVVERAAGAADAAAEA
ncbi:MAG: 30S ribosomal protein S17 [Gammaproteobacteria bacterium]